MHKIIDFVLLLDNAAVATQATDGKGWRVNRFGVVPNQFDDNDEKMLISDHRLVVAGLEWV